MMRIAPRAEHAAGMAQERRGLVRLEIADGRAGKEADARQARDRARQPERLGEIGRDRQHRKPRIFVPQLGRLLRAAFRAEMSTGT